MMRTLCARIKMFFKEYPDSELKGKQPALKKMLFELPDIERLLIVMHVGGRFSVEETAAFTGMTVGGVRKRINKAKQTLGIED